MSNAVNTWLYSRLQGGSALTALLSGTTAIYNLQAPDGAVLPYVVYSLQGGGDENQTTKRMKNLVYNVRAYANTASQAGSIDVQIDARLHGAQTQITGWDHIWCMREQDIELVETDTSRKQIYSYGGLYRIRISLT